MNKWEIDRSDPKSE